MAEERLVILVKHAVPDIDPAVPAHRWRLSEEGRRRAEDLGRVLKAYRPGAVASSVEPKARETAEIAARSLGLPCLAWPGLHEHRRAGTGFLTRERFEAAVADFFARPAVQVMGEETADAAHTRFRDALEALLSAHPANNLAVVTHGTVITLFVSRALGLEPYPLWRRLGLPSLVVLGWPGPTLRGVVDRV